MLGFHLKSQEQETAVCACLVLMGDLDKGEGGGEGAEIKGGVISETWLSNSPDHSNEKKKKEKKRQIQHCCFKASSFWFSLVAMINIRDTHFLALSLPGIVVAVLNCGSEMRMFSKFSNLFTTAR